MPEKDTAVVEEEIISLLPLESCADTRVGIELVNTNDDNKCF